MRDSASEFVVEPVDDLDPRIDSIAGLRWPLLVAARHERESGVTVLVAA